jgi:hypothetical protein
MTTGKNKRSPDQIHAAMQDQHANLHDAVHKVLASAGLKGVALHSMRFTVSSNAMDGSPCGPDCPPGHCTVVSDPNGFHWECV